MRSPTTELEPARSVHLERAQVRGFLVGVVGMGCNV